MNTARWLGSIYPQRMLVDEVRDAFAVSVRIAEQRGWATARVSLDQILDARRECAFTVIPTRRNDSPIGSLASVPRELAKPGSLSAAVGLDAMPLHNDGAHLLEPPDFVVLQALNGASGADTLLWHVDNDENTEDMRQGVFAVRGNTSAFCAHAMDSQGRVRYDSMRMRPRDASARRVAAYFRLRADSAHRHHWSGDPEHVLLIDNRRTVHGRTAAAVGPRRELRRLMLRRAE